MAGGLKTTLNCDILIAGAGLAGLSLLYRAMKDGHWVDQKIIVVDKCISERPNKNWSFWKKSAGPFDHLIYKTWDKLSFYSFKGTRKKLSLGKYAYHTIKSSHFYEHCLTFLGQYENITFIEDEIVTLGGSKERCYLETKEYNFTSSYLFNSVYQEPKLKPDRQYFLQHFKGLLVRSTDLNLDPCEAYLMDFQTSQEHGTTFFYTLPLSSTEVFIEYTIFSKDLLPQAEYDEKLKIYLRDILQVKDYEILEEEYGVIPMTDHLFTRFQGNLVNIGSAGGDTRGATGYTFTNIQKTISAILASWSMTKTPFFESESISLKHQIYDACLLHVLDSGNYKGNKVFEDLFMHTKASTIFSFLDAESSLIEDAAVIIGLKPWAFLKAMIFVIKTRLGR